jgi:phospholipase A-2-activating protein
LPTSYVDQIVKFLETNTQGSTLGESGSQDPFTGGSSYRSSRDPNVPAAGDPFTGGTAYTSSSSGIGPLASYQPGGRTAQDGTTAKSRFIPIRAAQYFRLANVEAVDKKIQEIIEGMDQVICLNSIILVYFSWS